MAQSAEPVCDDFAAEVLRLSFIDLSQWQKWTQRSCEPCWRHLVEKNGTLQYGCCANTPVSCAVSWLELKHTTLWARTCNRMFYASPLFHDSLCQTDSTYVFKGCCWKNFGTMRSPRLNICLCRWVAWEHSFPKRRWNGKEQKLLPYRQGIRA